MNYITEYNNLIQSGKIVVSRRVKQVYARLAAATAETSGQYIFDETRTNRPIAFIERFCKHSKGEWAGHSISLELFQKAYIQALYGFVDRDSGCRQYRESFFLVGRKNGKSTLLAGLALYMLTSDGEGGAEVYSTATKYAQARLLFDEAHMESEEFDISEFTFNTVKDVNLKDTFSFTSHISVYETCAVQYKLYKELQFTPVRVSALLFGMLVHQTIEDIHKAALRHEESTITDDNITRWFDANYTSLSKSERSYLAEPQRRAALNQVLRYAERQADSWDTIREAEVDISLVKPDYIIEGKIDLIKGEGDTVELVDFKSEKKPDLFRDKERIDRYQRQLQVYAHLVEERTGHKVSKMHLYYTGEESGVPTISFPYQKAAIDATIQEFDDTVHKIMRKEFSQTAQSPKTCQECDFRYYCGR